MIRRLTFAIVVSASIYWPITIAHAKPAPQPAGLVAAWSGNGKATDWKGHHDATLEGGAAYAAGLFGRQAFALNAPGAYVNIPASPDFDVLPTGQMTLSAWVLPATQGHYQAVIVKATQAGDWNWGIIIDPHDHFYTGHTAMDIGQSKTAIEPGHWFHVAVTYNNGEWKTYVNGIQENEAQGLLNLNPAATLALGHKGGQPAQTTDPDWFTGELQDVRFYSRALTADEVKALAAPQKTYF